MPTSGLAVVQDLYIMQVELEQLLEKDLTNPAERKAARQSVKTFEQLVEKADSAYMGGDDVLEYLCLLRDQANDRIKKATRAKRASRKK